MVSFCINKQKVLFPRKNSYEKGSLTVEAAIVLPLFILTICSLLYIIQIVTVHNTMQLALTETAYETGQYVTAYVKTGLVKDAEMAFNLVYRFIMNLDNIESSEQIDILEYENPMTAFFLSILTQKVQDGVANIVLRDMIKKYLSTSASSEKVLEQFGIINGINGLDFSGSEIFTDKRTIKLVMKYQIQPAIWLGEMTRLNMQNVAMIIPWQYGQNADDLKEEAFSAWIELKPIDRGKYIMEQEIEQILHQNKDKEVIIQNGSSFKAGVLPCRTEVFQEIVNIRSIDYTLSSYQTAGALEDTVFNEIDMLKKPQRYKDVETTKIYRMDSSTKRTMILVLPEGIVKPSNSIEKCFEYAHSQHVNLIVKYAYGKPMNEKSASSNKDSEDEEGYHSDNNQNNEVIQ